MSCGCSSCSTSGAEPADRRGSCACDGRSPDRSDEANSPELEMFAPSEAAYLEDIERYVVPQLVEPEPPVADGVSSASRGISYLEFESRLSVLLGLPQPGSRGDLVLRGLVAPRGTSWVLPWYPLGTSLHCNPAIPAIMPAGSAGDCRLQVQARRRKGRPAGLAPSSILCMGDEAESRVASPAGLVASCAVLGVGGSAPAQPPVEPPQQLEQSMADGVEEPLLMLPAGVPRPLADDGFADCCASHEAMPCLPLPAECYLGPATEFDDSRTRAADDFTVLSGVKRGKPGPGMSYLPSPDTDCYCLCWCVSPEEVARALLDGLPLLPFFRWDFGVGSVRLSAASSPAAVDLRSWTPSVKLPVVIRPAFSATLDQILASSSFGPVVIELHHTGPMDVSGLPSTVGRTSSEVDLAGSGGLFRPSLDRNSPRLLQPSGSSPVDGREPSVGSGR